MDESRRKALENDLSKQREHLMEWEKELQEKQRRLLDEQRLLNTREERANNADMILKKKEIEVEESRKKIDVTSSTLKTQEEDYKARSRALTVREKVRFYQIIFLQQLLLICYAIDADGYALFTIF